jgi:zinc/manganese transport system substrate-binding protein
MSSHGRRWAPLCSAAAVLLLAGCGNGAAASTSDGRVDVVASINVWGDIAATIGGDRVHVTSIVSDPAADPHSFEPTARTRLAVSRADVVIENGGGYDDFMARLLSGGRPRSVVIDAVDVSGKAAAAKAAGRDLNEHVWYDFAAVGTVAARLTDALTTADPAHAEDYRANAAAFRAKLDALVTAARADRARTQGAGVAVTEPVPMYLLDALGAVDRTPHAFSTAVEDGFDVAPAVLQQTLGLFRHGAVKALVYNEQTGDVQTENLKRAAERNQVAVVGVTETLPAGSSYVQWMTDNLAEISRALRS